MNGMDVCRTAVTQKIIGRIGKGKDMLFLVDSGRIEDGRYYFEEREE